MAQFKRAETDTGSPEVQIAQVQLSLHATQSNLH